MPFFSPGSERYTMNRRRVEGWAIQWVIGAFALALIPGLASAHRIPATKFDSPLPLPLLFLGAGVTVALTAGWLAVTERTPSRATRRMRVLHLPAPISMPLRLSARFVFLAGFVAALCIGIVGRQVQFENFATVFTWPVWFHGVALLSILVGTLWPVLSPWRALYRVIVWLEGEQHPPRVVPRATRQLASTGELHHRYRYTRKSNIHPEEASGVDDSRSRSLYARHGRREPPLRGGVLRRADPLGVLYRLFGRVASVAITRNANDGTDVVVRAPWQGTLTPVRSASLVLFAISAVYTVSFDGFTNTRTYQNLLVSVQNALGSGPTISILLYATGLSIFVVSFGLCSWLVERLGGGSTDRNTSNASEANTDGGYVVSSDERTREPGWRDSARHFAPTVLPIAAAYEVAHNYIYVFRNLARLTVVAVHPVAPTTHSVNPLAWLSLRYSGAPKSSSSFSGTSSPSSPHITLLSNGSRPPPRHDAVTSRSSC